MNIRQRIAGLQSFPYVNARVRAMREHLLTSNDYRKLEKMSPAEILEFLQQKDYKHDINRYSADYDDIDLLEKALDHHLARIYEKLMDISPDVLQDLLRAYFQRIDIQNLKTVLRKQRRGTDREIEDMLLPTHDLPEERLEELASMDRMEDLLEAIELPGGGTLADRAGAEDDLQEIERELDHAYYIYLLDVAETVPTQGDLFHEFLILEVTARNIGLVLRMKKNGFEATEIRDEILGVQDEIETDIEDLITADGYEEARSLLMEKDIGTYVKDDHDIAEVEQALERYKLSRGTLMLHQQPLSINPVLGYMIAKQAEVANLRIILQANKAGLGEEFMDANLIREVKER